MLTQKQRGAYVAVGHAPFVCDPLAQLLEFIYNLRKYILLAISR